jgi:hypothetical protein
MEEDFRKEIAIEFPDEEEFPVDSSVQIDDLRKKGWILHEHHGIGVFYWLRKNFMIFSSSGRFDHEKKDWEIKRGWYGRILTFDEAIALHELCNSEESHAITSKMEFRFDVGPLKNPVDIIDPLMTIKRRIYNYPYLRRKL